MGYSGQPMVTVKNNRNLLGKRKKLFDIKPSTTSKEDQLKELFNNEKDYISLYEIDQISKRRSSHISRIKKEHYIKNIISLVALIVLIITLTYIINYIIN